MIFGRRGEKRAPLLTYERILVPFHSQEGARVVGYTYAAASPAVS